MIEKILKYIKENFVFILSLILIITIFYVELPYVVYAPGNISNASERLTINKKSKKTKGSLNMASVKGLKPSLPFVLLGKIIPEWDVIKADKIKLDNETIEQMDYRDKLLLDEGNNNAKIVALNSTDISYEIINRVNHVTYITKENKSNIQVGDQLLKYDNHIFMDFNDFVKYISSLNIGTKINILAKRASKELNLEAEVYEQDARKLIGVMITPTFDIKTDFKLDIKKDNNESGPSGGLMMALAIYDKLVDVDLTKGKIIVGTGTIDQLGNVGEIGGVKYKLIGAVNNKADLFIVPQNNLEEALQIKKQYNYKINIIGVKTFSEVVEMLTNNWYTN